jgi:glycosyltransferase involved in cell wall biosynthesis
MGECLMRLGLVLDQIVFKREEMYSTDEAFIQFVEAFASPIFERIDFCSRVLSIPNDAPYLLNPARFGVCRLPWYPDIAALCLKSPFLLPQIAQLLEHWMSRWDILIACGVHPITSLALRIARRRNLPMLLCVRGDLGADIRCKYRGLRRLMGLLAARVTTASIPHGIPVVSVGRDDYAFFSHMGPVHIFFDSKFGEEDLLFTPRTHGARNRPTRLLYVGRISPEKGLEVLLDAMDLLISEISPRPVSLTIAGADFYGSSYGEELRARVVTSSIADFVTFTGYVPFGAALFELYDSHDIVILPSFTEGFPQVLFEAMARGVPIIATTAGGIPRIIQNRCNGLLIAPGNGAALARAVGELIADPELYCRLSSEGLFCAQAHTRHTEIASMRRFIAACLPEMRITDLALSVSTYVDRT